MNAIWPYTLSRQLRQLQPGDVLGFSSCDAVGAGINLATMGIPFWSISHVAIVAQSQAPDRLLLFESTTQHPQACAIQGRVVNGVQAHGPAPRVASYCGKVWVYPISHRLEAVAARQLSRFCHGALGIPYDCLGAFRSRTLGFWERAALSRREQLNSLFCSEFVAAALRQVGAFPTRNASRWNPNKLLRTLVRRSVLRPPVRLK